MISSKRMPERNSLSVRAEMAQTLLHISGISEAESERLEVEHILCLRSLPSGSLHRIRLHLPDAVGEFVIKSL